MKRSNLISITLMLFLVIANRSFGQNADKGFIGISAGPTIPLGNFASPQGGYATTGAQLNLFTMGYKFADNIGFSLNWFGAALPIGGNGGTWGYGGITLGPLIAIPSETVEFDLRPMIGLTDALWLPTSVGSNQTLGQSYAVYTLGLDLGATIRFNVSHKMAIIFNADYFSSKPEFNVSTGFGGESSPTQFTQKISAISITFGIAWRLR